MSVQFQTVKGATKEGRGSWDSASVFSRPDLPLEVLLRIRSRIAVANLGQLREAIA